MKTLKTVLRNDFVLTKNIEPLKNLPFTIPAGCSVMAEYNPDLDGPTIIGLNNVGKKYNVHVQRTNKCKNYKPEGTNFLGICELDLSNDSYNAKLMWCTHEQFVTFQNDEQDFDFVPYIIMGEQEVKEIFN